MIKIFKNIMRYISNYELFTQNESLKGWLSTFLIMSSLGLVPLSVKTADASTKKEFIKSQPDVKVDAAKFIQFLNDNQYQNIDDRIWSKFISTDPTVKSSLDETKSNIYRNGKKWNFKKDYQVNDFSSVDINTFNPTNYLTDMGSFIPDSLESNINNMIADYEQKTTVEIAVVTVKSLNDVPIEDYATAQFRRLGIGKAGANNGIMIIFSMDDRKSRIETGYGMEEYLPDAYCNRILTEIVRPNFKKGDYYEGTFEAIQEIEKLLGNDVYAHKVEWNKQMKKISDARFEVAKDEFFSFLGDAFMVLLGLSLVGYLIYRKRKDNLNKAEINKLLEKISETKKIIDSLDVKDKSRILENLAKKVKEMGENSTQLAADSSKIKDIDSRLAHLDSINDELKSAISNFYESSNKIQSNIRSIKNVDNDIKNAYTTLDEAIRAYNKIKNYGYNANPPKSKDEIQGFIDLATKAKSLLPTDVDEATKVYATFMTMLSTVVKSGENSISSLNHIRSAEQSVLGAKGLVDNAINNLNSYEKWAQGNEKAKITDDVKKAYADFLAIKNDVLKSKDKLDSVLRIISNMLAIWKGRKDAEERKKREEEERIRRKKREEEEEDDRRRRSSYSGSDSSSSSSFGGFGGGSSGGGGSSSSW